MKKINRKLIELIENIDVSLCHNSQQVEIIFFFFVNSVRWTDIILIMNNNEKSIFHKYKRKGKYLFVKRKNYLIMENIKNNKKRTWVKKNNK